MHLFLARLVRLGELHLAYDEFSVRPVCRLEVRRRAEWEEAHKVL
jgi:hypothetical protein